MRIVVLLASALAALVPSARASGPPQQPAKGGGTAAAQAAKVTAATGAAQAAAAIAPGGTAASRSEWQSGVGEWLGAPCRIIVQHDDGKSFEADCFTPQGLHHPFRGTYTSPNLIEGTVTRTDPSGCQVPVPMSIHLTDANHAEYTHPGFTGCGVNNAGPASAWPITRAQPVATASTANPAQQSSRSSTPAEKTTAKSGTASGAHPGTAAQSQSGKTPAVIRTAQAPAIKAKTTVPPKPAIRRPVELPVKPAN